MKLFSDCSGPCVVCSASGGGCLAGHGDDDFSVASKEKLLKMLELHRWGGKPDGRELTHDEMETVRRYLLDTYGVKESPVACTETCSYCFASAPGEIQCQNPCAVVALPSEMYRYVHTEHRCLNHYTHKIFTNKSE